MYVLKYHKDMVLPVYWTKCMGWSASQRAAFRFKTRKLAQAELKRRIDMAFFAQAELKGRIDMAFFENTGWKDVRVVKLVRKRA